MPPPSIPEQIAALTTRMDAAEAAIDEVRDSLLDTIVELLDLKDATATALARLEVSLRVLCEYRAFSRSQKAARLALEGVPPVEAVVPPPLILPLVLP